MPLLVKRAFSARIFAEKVKDPNLRQQIRNNVAATQINFGF